MQKILKNKRYFLLGGGIFLFIILFLITYLLSTDEYTDSKFRTMQNTISSLEKVDLTGLRELQASGGPIIDFPDLKKKLGHLNKDIIIVDGMRENHSYINDMPTTFLGYHRKKPGSRYYIRRLFFTGTTHILSERALSESKMAQKYGFGHKNIKIDSKINTPDRSVDEFVSYVDNLPKNVWLHFHCRHGKGRTSMMLVMYDIMKNAPKVALKDIIKRQHLIGSVDLSNTTVWKTKKKGKYTSRTLQRRKKFIEDFYVFVCQRKAGGIQRWSDWNKKQKKEKGNNL